ncbi:MAG: DUF4266 domain-containing protein [Myxococcales bacterium]|nr:DUF4266 domain-containing protein [Myxococcota bacterium]MDW8282530.1 DUF4266 domain-containing protein [Myxococcales bacterium]
MLRPLLCLLLAVGGGCVRVKPYQREHLAERCMTPFGDSSETKFRAHWEGSRTALEGGYCAAAGGGCGCN